MPRLYLGNLAYTATEKDIADAFSSVGIVVSMTRIPKDRETGQARGFAFVETDTDAQAAIDSVDGMVICGRPVKVDVALEKRRDNNGATAPRSYQGANRHDSRSPRDTFGDEDPYGRHHGDSRRRRG